MQLSTSDLRRRDEATAQRSGRCMPELPDLAEVLEGEHRLPAELHVLDVADERGRDAAEDNERRQVPLEKRETRAACTGE